MIRKTFLAAVLAVAALSGTQAQAHSPAPAPWPVWAMGGGVLSIMVRAAYVYRTECRELTVEEAFGGMGPWPVYQRVNNQCKPAAAPVVARTAVIGRY